MEAAAEAVVEADENHRQDEAAWLRASDLDRDVRGLSRIEGI